jgi:hypothetical protein
MISPQTAGLIMAVVQFGMWVISGVEVLVGEQISAHIGNGWLMTIIAIVDAIFLVPLVFVIRAGYKKEPMAMENMNVSAAFHA